MPQGWRPAQARPMTTLISRDAEDRADRVHSLGAVVTAVTVLTTLLVGASYAVAQVVQVATWALAGS